jgi:hypothetical protein
MDKASLQYNERKFEKCDVRISCIVNVTRDSRIWIDEHGMNKN